MRFIRYYNRDGAVAQGNDLGDGMVQPLAGNLFGGLEGLKPVGNPEPYSRLLAPIDPVDIYCIGLNYREHATESGMEFPPSPVVFMKPVSSVAAPEQPIVIPHCCSPEGEVDYECELAVVIGRRAHNVFESEALDYVLGYTAANDVSAREWQLHGGGGQWVRGKAFDTFCPLGPALVTADEIPDPQSLSIRTLLNGEVMQDHTTADMIFNVRQLVSFLSQDTTLLPGTVILTGTPQGVGFARKPPVWLKPGDRVVVEVERIGQLANPVAAAF